MSNSSDKSNRDPYIDEDHLYHKYEMMKMANERNMKEKHQALAKIKQLEEENAKLMEAYKCLQVIDKQLDELICISLYKNESGHKAIKQALKNGQ